MNTNVHVFILSFLVDFVLDQKNVPLLEAYDKWRNWADGKVCAKLVIPPNYRLHRRWRFNEGALYFHVQNVLFFLSLLLFYMCLVCTFFFTLKTGSYMLIWKDKLSTRLTCILHLYKYISINNTCLINK
jgi:hypothetical protein